MWAAAAGEALHQWNQVATGELVQRTLLRLVLELVLELVLQWLAARVLVIMQGLPPWLLLGLGLPAGLQPAAGV